MLRPPARSDCSGPTSRPMETQVRKRLKNDISVQLLTVQLCLMSGVKVPYYPLWTAVPFGYTSNAHTDCFSKLCMRLVVMGTYLTAFIFEACSLLSRSPFDSWLFSSSSTDHRVSTTGFSNKHHPFLPETLTAMKRLYLKKGHCTHLR